MKCIDIELMDQITGYEFDKTLSHSVWLQVNSRLVEKLKKSLYWDLEFIIEDQRLNIKEA